MTAQQKLIDFNIIFDDLQRFIKNRHNAKVYSYQKPFIRDIAWSVYNRAGIDIVGEFCRQSGKTTALKFVSDYMLHLFPCVNRDYAEKGIHIGFFAPKIEQSKICSERLRLEVPWEKDDTYDVIKFGAEWVLLDNKVAAEVWDVKHAFVEFLPISGAPTASQEGPTFDLIVCDEAQGLTEQVVVQKIKPMGGAKNATVVFIGTAKPEMCYFYKKIQYEKMKGHYYFVEVEEARKENPHLGLFYDKEVLEHGKDSIYIQTQYHMKWIFEQGMFTTLQEILAMQCEPRLIKGRLPLWLASSPENFDKEVICFGSVDPARNVDSTFAGAFAFARARPDKIYLFDMLEIEPKPGKVTEYPEQGRALRTFFERNHAHKNVAMDVTGELSAYDYWRREFNITCPINYKHNYNMLSGPAPGYHIVKDTLRNEMTNSSIVLPVFDKSEAYKHFVDQGINLQIKIVQDYFEKMTHPEGGHDDGWHMLGLGAVLAQQLRGRRVNLN